MYADDLVILSENSSGLQTALNKLKTFCNKWHLTINLKKNKNPIFNKGGHAIKKTNSTWTTFQLKKQMYINT